MTGEPISAEIDTPTEIIWGINGIFFDATDPLFDSGFAAEPLGVDSPLLLLGHASLAFNDGITLDRSNRIPDPDQGVHVGSATQCAISLYSKRYDATVADRYTKKKLVDTSWGKFLHTDTELSG